METVLSNKRLYVVERRRDNDPILFVRASHILHAHYEGEKRTDESFRVREATVYERALVAIDQIVEAA